MCSLSHFRLEEVTLNLNEKLFQRWGYNVAFSSTHNEATVELISFFRGRHQKWSCIQPHCCPHKLSCWNPQASKLHTNTFLGWEDYIVKEYIYYIMHFYWILDYRDNCGFWPFCALQVASTTIVMWPFSLFSVEFGCSLPAVKAAENVWR